MSNKVYVLGGAQTDFERNWSKEGKGFLALLKEVIEDGLKNTGLTYHDIIELNKQNRIACFIGNFIGEYFVNQGHLGALLTEVNPVFSGVPSARYEAACASGSVALDAAITKIRANEFDLALVIGWEIMKTVDSKVCGDFLGRAAFYEEEALGIDFPFPKLFGKLAKETITRYQLDEDRYLKNLARIAEINYTNAKKNPNTQTRKWFMNKAQALMRGSSSNRFVGEKLAVFDCSQVTDGAAFVAIASEKYINDQDRNKEYPIVKGWGHRVAPMKYDKKIEESENQKYILPWTRQTVVDTYRRANMNINDIDFFETHDCFTSSEYVAISTLGITEPGYEYDAIEKDWITFDGDKPINASGGLIGCGHPVGASGVRMFLDLYKQVAGKADGYQLKKTDNGMMLNIGGSATTNYAFIIGKDEGES
jgi:acetyl-CoA C-acetyltransferase